MLFRSAYYVSHASPANYQPSNITFGIIEPPPAPEGKRRGRLDRKVALSTRALAALDEWMAGATPHVHA